MSYIIKNYQEEFLEKQVEIGTEVFKDYKNAGMTPVEQLKQVYSGENFDPEMKFYVFKDNEMVGFLTSTPALNQNEDEPKKAFMEFPVLKNDHVEAHDQVIQTAYDTLKNKGYDIVRTRVSEEWGPTVSWADKYGYQKDNTIFKYSEFDIQSLDTSKLADASGLVDLDWETDENAVNVFIQEFYGITEEQAAGAINQIKGLDENIITHHVIKESGKIMGRMMSYRNPNNLSEIYFTTIMTRGENEEQNRQGLFKAAVEKLKKLENIDHGTIFLNGGAIANESQYKNFGISFKEGLAFYERKL